MMANETHSLSAKKENPSKTDFFVFYLLLAAAIYFVYLLPKLSPQFFMFLLVWAWFSKKYYFWFGFFFVILDCPANFFVFDPSQHLPLLKLMPGVSLTPIDVFTVCMIIRLLLRHKRINLALKVPFMFLAVYFIFSFFWGIFFYSDSLNGAINYLRSVVYYSWYVLFIAFINSKEKVFKFIKLLFPIIFFIFLSQIYFLLNGEEFIFRFNPAPYVSPEITTNTITGELRPIIGGIELMLLGYIGALLLIKRGTKMIKKPYFYLIIVVVLLSVIISATRVLFAIFGLIFVGVFVKKLKGLAQFITAILWILLLLFIVTKFGIISEHYLKFSAWGRVSQIFMFFQGRGSEIDTFGSRLSQLNVLLDKISQSLPFGYGFSDVSQQYYNNNLGLVNTILLFGVCGLMLFIFLFISYFKMLFSALRKMKEGSIYKESVRVLLVSFVVMLMSYFFTWDFFTPYYSFRIASMMIFFGISEIVARGDAPEIAKI